ncbi:hypothetical protein KW503_08175 [Vibrio fluvialis]|nr:hypothetical protein [Vibrio fluvialis]MBY8171086.1 hypothetical protein [Vibrio fluvialis]
MPKKTILTYIHEILSYNVIGSVQYNNRYNGFNGELHFSQWFRQNKKSKTYPGGLFVPLSDTDNSFEDSIYILTAPFGDDSYITEQLKKASPLSVRGQYLVRYDATEALSNWLTLAIPKLDGFVHVPYPSSLQIQKYDDNSDSFIQITIEEFWSSTGLRSAFTTKALIPDQMRNFYLDKFDQYDYADILDLYVNRFVLDGLCAVHGVNQEFQRGAPLDIDCFALGKTGQWIILEIKEKNLSRNGCFGMDIRRIDSLIKLQNSFSTSAFYVVRHIDNQEDRNFLGWKVIDMETFDRMASNRRVEGGHGMRGENTSNPTRLCKVNYFKELKSELTS